MKYIKLFEDNKEELNKLIPELEELYQDLTDRGFEIYIRSCYIRKITFPDDKSMISDDDISNYMSSDLIDMLSIEINKYDRDFNIDNNLINNLLFIESYTEGELGLKVNSYETINNSIFYNYNHEYYYKNIKNLPRRKKIDTLTIDFYKA